MNKSIFLVAVLVLALVGCQGRFGIDGGLNPSGLCDTPKTHCINVYIIGGAIKVDIDSLYVYGPNHKIYWVLDPGTTNGYLFPNNGIVMPNNPNPEFPGCQAIQNGFMYFCNDLNTKSGSYKYTINLTGPQPVPALDPSILNG